MSSRKLPNVLIAGTPGTGKSTICEKLRQLVPDLKHIKISEFCKTNDCIESHDEELDTDVIDENLMLDKLHPIISGGGYLIDYHSADLFPIEDIDVVFVIQCNNTTLYDRLKDRQYCDLKITNNIECEIFHTITEEAIEWFGEDSVHQLINDTTEQLDNNCQQIVDWIQEFKSK